METGISKARSRMTRQRERRAGRIAGLQAGSATGQVGRFSVALLAFLSVASLGGMRLPTEQAGAAGSFLPLVGDATLLAIGLAVAVLMLKVHQPEILRRFSRLLMLYGASMMALLPARAILSAMKGNLMLPPASEVFLLPFGIAPFLVTLLAGSATGFAVGLWTSVGMALMSRRDLLILLMGFLNAGFIAFAARAVKTRSKALRVGALAGLVCAPAVLASWGPAWEHADVLAILFRVGACVLSGIISALAGLLLLPLFERLFGLTSNITLFDFSDLGHPLLQRLALDAHWTYHHSLIVANLAQAAADEVGANPVLARVGAYFHDVGKLAKPRFFSENVPMQKNPHDDLSPSMSALLVTSHVKEGLSLALLYRLPKPVVDVIREHHGTGLVSYFHFKAKAAAATELEFRSHLPAEASPRVDESAFRYAGPKPRSRESGIIGLADAVEAASRSLAKVTPRHIESLVDEIVTARIEDGQLDHCPLTLADVRKISKSFVFTLSNVLHARVPYPRNENRD